MSVLSSHTGLQPFFSLLAMSPVLVLQPLFLLALTLALITLSSYLVTFSITTAGGDKYVSGFWTERKHLLPIGKELEQGLRRFMLPSVV